MNMQWAAILLLIAFTSIRASAQNKGDTDVGGRRVVALADGWRFHKGAEQDAEAISHSDDSWESVSVPHTWNAQDGADGGGNYFKGDGWYRRHIIVNDSMADKSLYLRFQAANRKADVYINGKLIGSHAGGESAFCFDVTDALKPGDNVLAVKVNNSDDPTIPPLSADFTFWGGIYRPVELLVLDPLHISTMDYASSGVYMTTPEVSEREAKVVVRALVSNSGKAAESCSVHVEIGGGENIKTAAESEVVTIQPGQTKEVVKEISVVAPRRWAGRRDPFLYSATVAVKRTGSSAKPVAATDSLTIPFGIRSFHVDAAKGFILNDAPYELHGVNRHQDRQGKGWAISEADHREDMDLIKEMGCTAIRLAHYQHADYFYHLADEAGMVVWAEVPVVNNLGATEAFTKNAQQQYIELIRQNFNHPSICFWSAGNEVDPPRAARGNARGRGPATPDVFPWFKAMGELAHKEDPSRLSTVAWREQVTPPADVTDVFGLNPYMGWYSGGQTNGWTALDAYITRNSTGAAAANKGKWAVSEYGAGSSIYFHSENPVRMDHTEEYQCLFHENYWKVLDKHPEIWGKFLWNIFDFGIDSRAEGDHAGINDKGMVTYDRKTRKDVFYFYKAVWSSEPTVYIASKRFEIRGKQTIPVKVYTNSAKASLTVNGISLDEKKPDNGTIVWNATLKEGKNEVVVTATTSDGKRLQDKTAWTYTPGAPEEVYVAQDERMKRALESGPPRAR